MSSPFETYARLYLHVFKLASRALMRRWMYLFLAPAIAIPFGIIEQAVGRIGAANEGASLVGGFVNGLLIAAATSAVIFVGRAIIEQRILTFDDFLTGFVAFLNDVLAVLFVLWIASYVARIIPLLELVLLLVPVVMPLFETVALSSVGGYGVFEAAWRFLRRDTLPWLLGQAPLFLLIPLYIVGTVAIDQIDAVAPLSAVRWLDRFLPPSLYFVLLLIAFVYRGILFLTLDNTSPRARAERFGGDPGLR